jgi:hypothetical protein
MGRRWLGPKHAIKVRKNPLHYTTKIEDSKSCIRCRRWLHKSAYVYAGQTVGVCAECRITLFSGRADQAG